MKLVFLNRSKQDNDDFNNANIVPLNGFAAWSLWKSKSEFVNIEDYYDFDFMKNNKEFIWRLFENLLDKGDKILGSYYKDVDLEKFGPFNLNAWNICRAIQSQIAYLLIFKNIINKHRPQLVELHGGTLVFTENYCQYMGSSFDVFDRLLVKLLVENKVEYRKSKIEDCQDGKQPVKLQPSITVLLRKSQSILKIYRYLRIHLRDYLINEEIDSKQRIPSAAFFLQEEWGVRYYAQYFSKVYWAKDLHEELSKVNLERPNIPEIDFATELNNEMMAFNDLFKMDLNFIIEDAILRYMHKMVLDVTIASHFREYFSHSDIRHCFCTNPDNAMQPVLMASKWHPQMTNVIKLHGDSIYSHTLWRNNELKLNDICLFENDEYTDYFSKERSLAGYKSTCVTDAVRYIAKGKRNNVKSHKTILYVPHFYNANVRMFDQDNLFDAQYFRVQTQIMRFLNEINDYDIICKLCPGKAMEYHYPLPQFIHESYPRVKMSNRSLKAELEKADYCLLDNPSSSMWEAINYGVPCHSLVWAKMHIRESANILYKDFITYYDSENDVYSKLNDIWINKKFAVVNNADRMGFKKKSLDEIMSLFMRN